MLDMYVLFSSTIIMVIIVLVFLLQVGNFELDLTSYTFF